MRKVFVELSENKSYEILIGKGLVLKENIFKEFSQDRNFLVVTDENLHSFYKDKFGISDDFIYVLKPGEGSKVFSVVEDICRRAVRMGIDRKGCFYAFGGGVVGDICGFAASIYMRGIRYVQIPTTLLAMVDSSVGGKTAVDLPEGKNLIGTFWQPSKVLIDPSFLQTLPRRELSCGLAEVIKYGMILDEEFFSFLEKNMEKILSLDSELLEVVIERCCKMKAKVVEEDEKEDGLRMILNYGHTFGHAIEKICGYGNLLHGEAVALGMQMSAKFAILSGSDFSLEEERRQIKLIKRAGLPVNCECNAEQIYETMFSDKKARAGKLRIIIPERIGKVTVVENPPREILLKAVRSCAV